jgi:methylated-DNA-[protein]-cysteine S-methyltransferase
MNRKNHVCIQHTQGVRGTTHSGRWDNMAETLDLIVDRLETAIGQLLILADGEGNLRAAEWVEHEPAMHRFLRLHFGGHGFRIRPVPNPNGLTDALGRYFAGDLRAIDNLPVRTHGTAFQQQVWQTLRKIPCSTTISYGELARQIGRPAAVRAVGLANGSNPIPIVVPCHRVIGSDGSLTGYGGGIERKRWLLEHERCANFERQKRLPYAASTSTEKLATATQARK